MEKFLLLCVSVPLWLRSATSARAPGAAAPSPHAGLAAKAVSMSPRSFSGASLGA